MDRTQCRLDRIIRAVIRKTGLAAVMGFDDASQTLHLAVYEAWRDPKLRAYETWADPELAPEPLLWTIVYRRAVDHGRLLRHRAKVVVPSNDEGDWSDAVAPLGRDPPPSVEGCVAIVEILALLDDPGVLDERERTFIRRSMAGETQAEIGKDEGISRGRVQQIIDRGIDKIRRRS
jgi:DNA-directed RNA polymerase specialized sigma24 family protein